MLDNFWDEFLILILRVLLIQDAVFILLDPHAPKAVCSGDTALIAVREAVDPIVAGTTEAEIVCTVAAFLAFVHSF